MWCIQRESQPEIWQWDFVDKKEVPFDIQWLQKPVDICQIRKFSIYHRNRTFYVSVLPSHGAFFIDGKKYRWKEFDPHKPSWLVYGRLNRAHISQTGVSRDPTIQVIGYRQENHHVYFYCMGVSTDSGTYGRFDYSP